MSNQTLLATYLRQQRELGMPDFFAAPDSLHSLIATSVLSTNKQPLSHPLITAPHHHTSAMPPPPPAREPTPRGTKNRLLSLRPVKELIASAPTNRTEQQATSTTESKRNRLAALYRTGCTACHLAQTRTSFVFGGGSAEAPVMIIGEAPGRDEDLQGKPFVGAAGKLLTSMLSAINFDRTKDVFITNILKCRPPGNRNPESSEIVTCLPLLKQQIDIIQPRGILLLGRIAAHTLLDINQSIAKMRSRVFDYNGIPSMVIYHPAALLRNPDYKRPTWDDLKQFQTLLATSGIYGTLRKE